MDCLILGSVLTFVQCMKVSETEQLYNVGRRLLSQLRIPMSNSVVLSTFKSPEAEKG